MRNAFVSRDYDAAAKGSKGWNDFKAQEKENDELMESRIQLTRIFHHSRDEKAAKADGARQTQDFYQGCMSPYCPDKNSSLTQQLSAFPAFAVERDEISGLKCAAGDAGQGMRSTVTRRARLG